VRLELRTKSFELDDDDYAGWEDGTMRATEYAACDATELAELIRQGDVSADEVYAAAIEAIEAVNSEINAVADGPWAEPLPYAAKGRFGGVPFALKAVGACPEGIRTNHGSRLAGDGMASDRESSLVRRFREAGLAALALTTAPEFGLNANTEALVYGPTRNPWNLSRSAGGSSGGSAALVAAGALPAAHAGDGGGSTRIPAACNGLVGLKASRGRVSGWPFGGGLFDWGVEGVLTRTMRDTAAMLDVAAGAMPGDKFPVGTPARPFSAEVGADTGPLRIALHTSSWSGLPVDSEVADAAEAVARALEGLGHHVEHATPVFDWDAFVEVILAQFAVMAAATVDGISAVSGRAPGPDTLERTTLACCEHGRAVTALEMGRASYVSYQLSKCLGEFFTTYDVLITPTMAVPPLPLGYLNANDGSLSAEGWVRRLFDVCCFTPLFNCTGNPALSLPLGCTSDGLPIGVQFGAAMCEEATLIRIGSLLEELMPWSDRRPGVHVAHASRIEDLDREEGIQPR
jgi:amidase